MTNSRINWGELFPSKKSIFIFITYMSLFVGQGKFRRQGILFARRGWLTELYHQSPSVLTSSLGILVTASQRADNSYSYNTVLVVLLTEVLKLIISTVLYCREWVLWVQVSQILTLANLWGLLFWNVTKYCTKACFGGGVQRVERTEDQLPTFSGDG